VLFRSMGQTFRVLETQKVSEAEFDGEKVTVGIIKVV
jgi:hypothetical protein